MTNSFSEKYNPPYYSLTLIGFLLGDTVLIELRSSPTIDGWLSAVLVVATIGRLGCQRLKPTFPL